MTNSVIDIIVYLLRLAKLFAFRQTKVTKHRLKCAKLLGKLAKSNKGSLSLDLEISTHGKMIRDRFRNTILLRE